MRWVPAVFCAVVLAAGPARACGLCQALVGNPPHLSNLNSQDTSTACFAPTGQQAQVSR
jgi:hypothetical protein